VGEVVLWKKGKRVLKEEERGYAIDWCENWSLVRA
jgi:hypothetical protein